MLSKVKILKYIPELNHFCQINYLFGGDNPIVIIIFQVANLIYLPAFILFPADCSLWAGKEVLKWKYVPFNALLKSCRFPTFLLPKTLILLQTANMIWPLFFLSPHHLLTGHCLTLQTGLLLALWSCQLCAVFENAGVVLCLHIFARIILSQLTKFSSNITINVSFTFLCIFLPYFLFQQRSYLLMMYYIFLFKIYLLFNFYLFIPTTMCHESSDFVCLLFVLCYIWFSFDFCCTISNSYKNSWQKVGVQ